MHKDDGANVVRLTGNLLCNSVEDAIVVRDRLPKHIRLTLAEPGCLSFRVWQSDDPLVWHVDEVFIDTSAFRHHQQRTRASAWRTATATIPRSYEITGLDPA